MRVIEAISLEIGENNVSSADQEIFDRCHF